MASAETTRKGFMHRLQDGGCIMSDDLSSGFADSGVVRHRPSR